MADIIQGITKLIVRDEAGAEYQVGVFGEPGIGLEITGKACNVDEGAPGHVRITSNVVLKSPEQKKAE